jgi:hypothetical protein
MRRACLRLAVLLVLLGGCSGSNTTAQRPSEQLVPAPLDVPEATGDRISTLEYSYRAPRGWGVVPHGAQPGTGRDETFDSQVWQAVDSRLADGVSVRRIGSAIDDLEDLEDLASDALTDQGASDVEVLPRVRVAGSPIVSIRATLAPSSGGGELRLRQFLFSHDDVTYILGFTFSTIDGEAEQERVATSVLASWRWS